MYKKTHPNMKERNMINYEIIRLALPFSFLGTFLGVQLGKIISE
jgi:hypothetical protein